MSAKPKVNVRMYRQGLGDCFLLTFRQGPRLTRMLIDCGVVLGAPKGEEKTKEVVRQLAKDCDGKLDVVVATHEHWDHVSGFATAKELFDDIQIGEIWMAWTEDPTDELANKIRKERGELVKKVGVALELWKARAQSAVELDQRQTARRNRAIAATESLLDFFGPGALGAKGDRTRQALNFLKEHGAPKKYLNPGDQEHLPNIDDVRVYALGPPRDLKLIKKDLPSKRDPETYEESMRVSASAAFLAAAASPAPGLDAQDELYQPFDAFYRIPPSQAQSQQFFTQHYGFQEGKASDSADGAPGWRRIDEDWLGVTSELALMLDSDTNNTSLVLAFELGEEGDVLLFAADAQVGNWLSWETVVFERGRITPNDLLKRTVFYKVGHHASHNATLEEKGLELMTSRRLAAFIPVDQPTAAKIGWKKMPFNPLLTRLREKCRHRIVRLDEGVDEDAPKTFFDSVEENDLFFDIELGG
jgi:hypothetical protein